jgi:hypothetical protein
VRRRFGYVGISPGDAPVFAALRRIFPILRGWMPSDPIERSQIVDGLEEHPLTSPEELQLELARSVLLLNVNGRLPEELLVDAAFYGVPCIGNRDGQAQQSLWPQLAVDDANEAVVAARAILTNAARLQQAADNSRIACREFYSRCEEKSAASLRRLYALEEAGAVALGG